VCVLSNTTERDDCSKGSILINVYYALSMIVDFLAVCNVKNSLCFFVTKWPVTFILTLVYSLFESEVHSGIM